VGAVIRQIALSVIVVVSLVINGMVAESFGAEIGADRPAVDRLFAKWDKLASPGCALAVGQDGAPIYTRGYGYANLDYDLPITPQTVFDVGSVTKQFTAASLSMLALEGKLSLDDDVRKWLPELPQYDWPITLRHMTHHTSGLRDYLNLFPLAGRGDYYPISHPQILAMLARQRALIFEPGEKYEYSNTAYMLLAQVVERAGGRSLGEMARARIFEPLGMADSVMYDDLEVIIPRRATGYAPGEEGRWRVVHNYNFDVVGDGQLYTTMVDLLRWDQFLHGSDRPAIHPLMLTEGRLNDGASIGYAQGIVLDEYRGQRTVGHSGSSWGFRTQLLRFVEPGLTIAISCNDDSADPGTLSRQVADLMLGDQLGPMAEKEETDVPALAASPTQVDISPSALTELAGTYFSPELDATYRFSVADEQLLVRIEQEQPLEVVAVGEDRFEIRFGEQGLSGPQTAGLVFEREQTGAVAGFSLSSGTERGIVFDRR
jgi:CubicO group peptidase (beta-lactamase class C family)